VASILFGLTTLQTHFYFQRFPNDTLWMKYFVATIWMFDALHIILCTHTMYYYLISNFGNGPALKTEVWSLALQTDCNGIIGMAVELFFARRVFKLSRNYAITGVITVFALIHFSLGIYFTVQAFMLQEFTKFGALTWVTCVGLGSAAAADLVIAISLVYSLQSARTGIARTDNIISTLIVYAINTGAVTSIVATICVFCFAFMPTNFIWLSFFWILGKLYANSLLANLNGREALRGRGKMDEGTVILPLSQMQSGVKSPKPMKSRYSMQGQSGLKVNVHTETMIYGRDQQLHYSPSSTQHYSPSSYHQTSPTRTSSPPPWNRVLHISEPLRNHTHLETPFEFDETHPRSSQDNNRSLPSHAF